MPGGQDDAAVDTSWCVAPIAAGQRGGAARAAATRMNRDAGDGRPAQSARAVRPVRAAALRPLRDAGPADDLQATSRSTASRPAPGRLSWPSSATATAPADAFLDRAGRARRARPARGSSRTARASAPTPTCSPGCAHAAPAGGELRQLGRPHACGRSARRARCARAARRRACRATRASRGRRRSAAAATSCSPSCEAESRGGPAGADAGGADAARLAARASCCILVAVPLLGTRRAAVPDRRLAAAALPAAHARDARPRDLPAARPRARIQRAGAQLEDHDITNQYTRASATVKPGLLPALAADRPATPARLCLPPHLPPRLPGAGADDPLRALGSSSTTSARVLFVSNYDGSHQSYMDDFINKVGWGLNLVFSNGVGCPRTRWLISAARASSSKFKHYQRRHQMPTAGLVQGLSGPALVDLKRNSCIREGVEQPTMSDAQAHGLAEAALSRGDPAMTSVELDYGDIQGLVRFGYRPRSRTPASCCCEIADREARARLAAGGPGHHRGDARRRRPRPRCRSRSPARACARSACPTPSSRASPTSSVAGMAPTPTARAASATSAPTHPTGWEWGGGAPACRTSW